MEMLTLGFDARPAVIDPHRGVGRVAAQLAGALLLRDDVSSTVFVPRGAHVPEAWYRGLVRIVQLPQPRRGAFLWDGPAWRWVLGRYPVDVLHLPAWGVPPGVPVPVVATLHDVIPLRFPEAIPSRRVRHRAVQRLGTYGRATLVHAVSRATARDAVHVLGIDPGRVRVVHNGVEMPVGESACDRRHVLYVGGGDPHKRVDLLLEAWALPHAEGVPPLVIAGGAAGRADVAAAAGRLPARIRLAGAVDDSTLEELYRRAVAVVMPSLWEGYGLPVVEGMARGAVPVITARASLPEVGADAALYVPATAGPEAWIGAVRQLVEDPRLRSRLAVRALELAERRSWDRCAEGMVELYRKAAGRGRVACV